MKTSLRSLPRPDTFDQSSSMWIDEAIWGHRLYDEQLPWLVFLEFLNVYQYEVAKGRVFKETDGLNTLRYRAHHRLSLRHLLFNNPFMIEIRMTIPDDEGRWREWLRRMKQAAGGRGFEYLKPHFHSFDEFCEVVALMRSTSLEVNSNKRWTSKFVFPYGDDCLYEDLNSEATTNDRRFFGRTGEVLYLMLCRSARKEELAVALASRLSSNDPKWNAIVGALQPQSDVEEGAYRANAFLPYETHECFDQLAEDWLALLSLSIPGFDVFPHLVCIAGFHLLKYQLTVARQLLGMSPTPIMVCEVVAPKKTLVREVSCECYQQNNLLSARAVDSFVSGLERSEQWKGALSHEDPFSGCKKVLGDLAHWGEDYDGPNTPEGLIGRLRQDAMKRHRQHVLHIHRNYGREVGLVSKRGTTKLRYAPNDELLKTLLFANVAKRTELQRLLETLSDRYGLVFSDREAEKVLSSGDYDRKAFRANAVRLEQRLGSLGLLRRLSDACAYVVNPHYGAMR